jgi:hypothetical protein
MVVGISVGSAGVDMAFSRKTEMFDYGKPAMSRRRNASRQSADSTACTKSKTVWML